MNPAEMSTQGRGVACEGVNQTADAGGGTSDSGNEWRNTLRAVENFSLLFALAGAGDSTPSFPQFTLTTPVHGPYHNIPGFSHPKHKYSDLESTYIIPQRPTISRLACPTYNQPQGPGGNHRSHRITDGPSSTLFP